MSGRLVGEVLDHAPEDLTTVQTLVLVALAEAATDRDRTARHNSGAADLARRCRTTPGVIRNALSTLARRGLIRPIHPRGTLRYGRTQEYEIARLQSRHRFATWGDVTPDRAAVNGTRPAPTTTHPRPRLVSPPSDTRDPD